MLGACSETGSISSSIGDTLNPDVPEFVPTELIGNSNGYTIMNGNNVNGNEHQFIKQKEDQAIFERTSNTLTTLLNSHKGNKSSAIDSSTSNSLPEGQEENEKRSSSNDNAWQEVPFCQLFYIKI